MKKMITLFSLFLLLSACTSQKKEKLTCEANGTNNAIVFKTVYYYTVGDEASNLVEMESETVVTFNGDDLTKESQEPLAKSAEKEFSTYDGISYSYTVDDKQLTEKVKADLTKLTTSDLDSLGMSIDLDVPFDLDQFKANLDVLGYTCK